MTMPPRTYGKTLGADKKVPRLDTAQALHADGSFWDDENEGVCVDTHGLPRVQKVIDLLIKMKREGRNVEHILVLVDEVHHASRCKRDALAKLELAALRITLISAPCTTSLKSVFEDTAAKAS